MPMPRDWLPTHSQNRPTSKAPRSNGMRPRRTTRRDPEGQDGQQGDDDDEEERQHVARLVEAPRLEVAQAVRGGPRQHEGDRRDPRADHDQPAHRDGRGLEGQVAEDPGDPGRGRAARRRGWVRGTGGDRAEAIRVPLVGPRRPQVGPGLRGHLGPPRPAIGGRGTGARARHRRTAFRARRPARLEGRATRRAGAGEGHGRGGVHQASPRPPRAALVSSADRIAAVAPSRTSAAPRRPTSTAVPAAAANHVATVASSVAPAGGDR